MLNTNLVAMVKSDRLNFFSYVFLPRMIIGLVVTLYRYFRG